MNLQSIVLRNLAPTNPEQQCTSVNLSGEKFVGELIEQSPVKFCISPEGLQSLSKVQVEVTESSIKAVGIDRTIEIDFNTTDNGTFLNKITSVQDSFGIYTKAEYDWNIIIYGATIRVEFTDRCMNFLPRLREIPIYILLTHIALDASTEKDEFTSIYD